MSRAADSVASSPRPRTTLVLDTSVLYCIADPYAIEEFQPLFPVDFVVPSKALWELDRLIERAETRDRARAALNVLKGFVQRGATSKPVSCGGACTVRIAALEEEAPHPGLRMELADDCILAVCIHLAQQGGSVKLATTEFALYAKALASGVGAMHLERYQETKASPTRRERASFQLAWSRVQAADSAWSACRRALFFLKNPLVARLIQPVRERQEPQWLASIIAQFDALDRAWTPETNLQAVIQATLGIAPATSADYSVRIIQEPMVWDYTGGRDHRMPSSRRETPEERALRIAAEEDSRKARDDFIVDVVLSNVEVIREFILDQVGEDLL